MKRWSCLPNDPKFVVCICFGAFWIAVRYCPMADSQLILDLLFLYIRCGCSLAGLLFFLMLVGTCCFIVCLSLHSASYVPSFTSARKFINYTTFLRGRNPIVSMKQYYCFNITLLLFQWNIAFVSIEQYYYCFGHFSINNEIWCGRKELMPLRVNFSHLLKLTSI